MSGYVVPSPLAPFPDESLAGFVMRSAEPYRFRNPMRLFRRLRLRNQLLWPLCQSDPDGDLGRKLGHLLGLDSSSLKRLSPWCADEAGTTVMGHRVWAELVPSDRRAVCPECLRASPHHKAVWQIAALPVCAVHGVRLLDRCPNPECGKPLKWSGRSLCECEWRGCRFDLRKSEAESVDPSFLPGLRRLLRLFDEDRPDAPFGAPVGEVLTLAFMLGRIALGFERMSRPVGLMERERTRVPELMDAGWRALDDWPNGFNRLLDRRRARGRNVRGVKQAFGGLSLLIHGWSREPWGAPLGKAFAEYVSAQSDMALSTRRLTRYAPGVDFEQAHVSLAQAAQALDIGPNATLALARRRGLIVLESKGMGVPSLLRSEDVKALSFAMGDALLPEEARKLLGIGRRLFTELEGAGFVRRVPEADRMMEYKPYVRSEIQDFIRTCVGRAPALSAAEADARGLTRLSRTKAPGHSIVKLCRALIDGRLKNRATVRTAQGLARIRIELADLRAVNRPGNGPPHRRPVGTPVRAGWCR